MAANMTAVTAKVLALPELLEEILIKLPQQDLLRVQRVNTIFRDIIQKPRVQRKLFLCVKEPTKRTIHPRINPLARRVLKAGTSDARNASASYPGKLRSFTVHIDHCKGTESGTKFGILRLPEGTWRDMWISDPAYDLVVYDTGKGSFHLPGMKLGDLQDELLRINSKHAAEKRGPGSGRH